MKTIILFTLLTCSINASEGWYNLNVNYSFGSVFFIDTNEGWSISANYIYHTIDGGKNWEIQFHQWADTPPLEKIRFIDRNNGYCVFWVAILSTSDGGKNWEWNEPVPSIPGYHIGLYLIDSVSGWKCGLHHVAKFWNRGKEQSYTWFQNIFYDIQFVGLEKGWVVGGYESIYSTTNGGDNWFVQHSSTDKNILYSVSFPDENNGWAVGTKGTILHTSDGGLNWEYQNSGVSVDLNSIQFVNSLNGWIVGDKGTILFTSDGGLNWAKQISSTSNGLFSVFFIDSKIGWAVGKDVILKTTNGGATFAENYDDSVIFTNIKPNPFEEQSTIEFTVEYYSPVKLCVYDGLGRQVKVLIDEYLYPGQYKQIFVSNGLLPGIYFIQLNQSNKLNTLKAIVYK